VLRKTAAQSFLRLKTLYEEAKLWLAAQAARGRSAIAKRPARISGAFARKPVPQSLFDLRLRDQIRV